jgi:hypothetical protein
MERAKEVLPPSETLRYAANLYEAAQDADAVLILTDWKEFAEIDLTRLNRAVHFPIVIDGRNLYKPKEMLDHGFTYVSVGRPAAYSGAAGQAAQAAGVEDRSGVSGVSKAGGVSTDNTREARLTPLTNRFRL